ncbi:MAG: nucleotidyltransferase domain-containing protein [Muribaculaceae bacterium]|nr:nucleotidyltransferase domain-containing protein [Muribaculaceae bacterium]
MCNLDLQEKYVSFIIKTVTAILPNTEIFIFGSRTQGKSRQYSDVDIALQDSNEIEFEQLLKLKAEFSNSTFPYKVDIIDLKSIDEKFYNIIKDDLCKIN